MNRIKNKYINISESLSDVAEVEELLEPEDTHYANITSTFITVFSQFHFLFERTEKN